MGEFSFHVTDFLVDSIGWVSFVGARSDDFDGVGGTTLLAVRPKVGGAEAPMLDFRELLLGDSLGTFDGLRETSGSALCFFGDVLDDRGGTRGVGISANGLRGELATWKIERSGELTGELGMPGNSSLNGIIDAIMRSGDVGGLFAGVFGFAGLLRSGERILRDGEAERNFSRAGGLRGDPKDDFVGETIEDVLNMLTMVLSWKTSSSAVNGDATLWTGAALLKLFGVLRGL